MFPNLVSNELINYIEFNYPLKTCSFHFLKNKSSSLEPWTRKIDVSLVMHLVTNATGDSIISFNRFLLPCTTHDEALEWLVSQGYF